MMAIDDWQRDTGAELLTVLAASQPSRKGAMATESLNNKSTYVPVIEKSHK